MLEGDYRSGRARLRGRRALGQLVLGFSFLARSGVCGDGAAPAASSDAPASASESAAAAASSDDQARSTARELASEGSEAYRAAQYEIAYDRFNRAFRLVLVPSLGVWSARSLERAGRLVESAERYREVLRLVPGEGASASHAEALENARAELDELRQRIPALLIRLENGEGEPSVTLNGQPVKPELIGVKQNVNPGQITVVATRGKDRVEQTVTLGERQSREIVLRLPEFVAPSEPVLAKGGENQSPTEPSSGAESSSLPTVGLVLGSVGGALLIGGSVFGIVALGQESDIAASCNADRECRDEGDVHDKIDAYDTSRTLSSVGLISGAVLGAVGLTLYFVGQPSSEAPEGREAAHRSSAPSLGPIRELSVFSSGSISGLRGRF